MTDERKMTWDELASENASLKSQLAQFHEALERERKPDWEKWLNELADNYLDESNPRHAHELIEVLRGEDWHFEIHTLGNKWHFLLSKTEREPQQSKGTFCRAVAECYLKVRGKWKD